MISYAIFSADQLLLACSTCMGDPGSPQVQAAGSAILFMLAVLAVVFGGMIAVVVSVARRARRSGGADTL